MATKILIKKSVTGGEAPLAGVLEQAELAVNLVDRKIYTKDNSGAIVTLDGAYVDSTAPGNPAEGDLWYDTANNILKAHNGSIFAAAGYQNLSELEDVTIDTIAAGEILKWSGTAFVNNTLAEADIQAASNTEADARSAVSVTDSGGDGSLAYNSGTGVITYQGPVQSDVLAHLSGGTGVSLSAGGEIALDFSDAGFKTTNVVEGTNLYYTTARARGAVSATDAGGDGSFAYNSSTGTFTYTGPSAAETRAHFTGGTGVSITNGSVAIGQAVSTTSNVTFNKVTTDTIEGGSVITIDPAGIGNNTGEVIIAGDLTVQGTTTSVNSNEVNIGDSIIVLNADEAGAPSENGGIEVERGTSSNVQFVWNETDDAWDLKGETLQNVTLNGGTY